MERFYNKGSSAEDRVEEHIPRHTKFLEKGNQNQIDEFYEGEIVLMKDLRESRHEISPFRNMVID